MTADKADEPPLIIDPADIELPPSTTVSIDLGEQSPKRSSTIER